MGPGQSLYVFGVDASGEFYQVLMSGDFYWVPVESMNRITTTYGVTLHCLPRWSNSHRGLKNVPVPRRS